MLARGQAIRLGRCIPDKNVETNNIWRTTWVFVSV